MNGPPADAEMEPDRDQVLSALDRIERSPAFVPSPRHRALLRHLVERTLDGDAQALKEMVIAVEVFGRSADRFDPRSDTIVRVEARRLRRRLADYYRAAGRDEPLQISVPVGGYVPLMRLRAPAVAHRATRRARDLCERGEHYLRQPLSGPSLRAAAERFEAALALSPDWAPAHVGRGRAWLNLATGWYEAPQQAAAVARGALDRALELEPGHAQALALRAALASVFDRDWPLARRLFQHAVQAAPQEAFVHSAYGAHLQKHGLFDEAEAELALARALDPQYLNTRAHMVNLRIGQRRYDDAEAELDALRDLAGDSIATLGMQAALALYRGDTATAVLRYRATCDALPDVPACGVALATALAADGQAEAADRLFGQASAQVGGDRLSPYLVAIFERWRGRPDAAFARLEDALAQRDPFSVQIPDEPSFDGLRADARWPGLSTRSRLP
ncbi:MAG: hypothetical protein U1F56_09135 [Rubrivivax sp.]